MGTAPVNSVYVFDDRVVLNFNFTDDAKTVTREEVLGSSAVDNAPLENNAEFLIYEGANAVGKGRVLGRTVPYKVKQQRK